VFRIYSGLVKCDNCKIWYYQQLLKKESALLSYIIHRITIFLLTHNSQIRVLSHSFKIRSLCRNFAFIISACVELKVDHGHSIHVRLVQLKYKKKRFLIKTFSEVYLIYASCRELILLPSSSEYFFTKLTDPFIFNVRDNAKFQQISFSLI
jgi:hypothetical protein